MTRLQSEWQRLYHPLIDADGRIRAMVLSLGKPADWEALSQVWQAVQAELSLPAPAIAVSGVDAYQLWFSLDEAVPVAEAHVFMTALQDCYLSHIAPARIACLPAPDEDPQPGREVRPGQWSAFVAPDLAPIFADTPWLDIPPSPEGQAELLSRVRRIKPADWRAALALLQPGQASVQPSMFIQAQATTGPQPDPRRFLLGVMNDEKVPLALRIEAAKALLPYTAAGS
jgi:hypothetical protein